MSKFFTAKKTEDAVVEYTGGSNSKYIGASGMFPVSIIAPFVNAGNAKATTIDLFVDYAEQKQVVYGNISYTNKDGSANVIGQDVFNKLVIVTGVDEINEPIEAELPIGKKGAMKDCAVLEDLADYEVVMQIRMEYGIYNNNITEKTVIKSFFRAEDYASAEEIVAAEAGKDVVFGTQYAKIAEGADYVQYHDGLDEAKVAEWIKAKRPKGTAGSSAAGQSESAVKKPSFGSKPKFGAK